jgi:hypothetical protein
MVSILVPDALLKLEPPFNLTDTNAFRRQLRSSVPEGSMIPAMLKSLPLILEAEVQRPCMTRLSEYLPEDLQDFSHVLDGSYSELMPTYADIRIELVRQALREFTRTDASEEDTTAALSDWLGANIDNMINVVTIDLTPQFIGSAYDTGIVPVMLDLTDRYVTRVRHKIGSRLLGRTAILAQDQIVPLLERLLASDTLSEELRRETVKMVSFVETMRRDREEARSRQEGTS